MKNKLFTAILILATASFFTPSLATMQAHSAQLLAHLKKVRFQLQQIIEYQQESIESFKEFYLENPKEHQGEIEPTLLLNLFDNFYQQSAILQQKLSESVTPTFNRICNITEPFSISDISVDMFQPYTESTFNENIRAQLRILFESIYNTYDDLQTYCKNNPTSDLAQTPIDELLDDALDTIIYCDGMLIYEIKTLLQKTEEKITAIEN